MQYISGTPANVRAASQRALCRYWADTAGDHLFPSLDQFRPDASLHDPKQINIWKVEGDTPHRAFRALYQGASVGEVFNSSWAGRLMQDVLPLPLRKLGTEAAEECVSTGYAIYCVFTTYTTAGQVVECERLLLPLGRGGRVEQIVASLQLTSVQETSINRDTVIRHFEWKTDVAYAMRIDSCSKSRTADQIEATQA